MSVLKIVSLLVITIMLTLAGIKILCPALCALAVFAFVFTIALFLQEIKGKQSPTKKERGTNE